MREFAVVFEKDITSKDIDLKNLTMNRIDSISRIISNTFFLSNDFRRDTVLYLVFPSIVIKIDGGKARHIHIDEKSIAGILKKVLEGKRHQGFFILENIELKDFLVLDEEGKKQKIHGEKFLLGEQKGIPEWIKKRIEKNKRISLGKKSYLTSQCIVVIHYELDRIEERT